MAQVRRQDDLAGGPVGARDRGAHDVEGRRVHFRGDRRAQDDPLSGRQPAAELLGLPFRNHEGEAVVQEVRREVSPADEVPVVAGPRGRLVGKRREKAGRLPLFAGEPVDRGKRAVGENDPAGDLLSGVVRRTGSRAHVDELGRNVGILTVVGERDRELGKGSHGPGTGRNLLQPRADRRPAVVAPEVRVAGFAVRRKTLDPRIGEAGRDELALQVFRGREVAGRTLDAVEPGQPAHRFQGLRAVHLGVDRGRHRVRPEGDRAIFRGGGARHEEERRREGRLHANRTTRGAP